LCTCKTPLPGTNKLPLKQQMLLLLLLTAKL
jgi:hypothetical protein